VTVFEPTQQQVLAFCARDPIERVFLEDIARRGFGRFVATGGDELTALCHVGANLVPSGEGCGAFADAASEGHARMIIGASGAVTDLWHASRDRLPEAREDRPHQPVYAIREPTLIGISRRQPARSG